MSLQEPTKKMSKSDENLNAFISMNDDRDTVIRKFKRAVTDSETVIKYDPENKAGISNLLTIYSLFANKSIADAEKEFDGKGYGDFKIAVGETVADALAPIQAEKERILKDKGQIDKLLFEGSQRAEYLARKTLSKVYKKVGLLPKIRG